MLDALVYFVNWKLIPELEIEAVLRELCSWGVSHLVFPPCWGEWEQQRPGVMQELAGKIRQHGLQTPAAHALWGKGLDMSCLEPEPRRQMLAQHAAFLRALAPLGVSTYTVHPGISEPKTTPEQWTAIRRSLDTLLPVAAETGIVLALENGHESLDDLRYLSALVAEYRHANLGLCFDSGHANSYSPLGAVGMVQLLADQLVTCHLHDNYGTGDDHNPPGKGNIPWTELVQALQKCPNLRHAESEAGDWQRPAWEKFQALWTSPATSGTAI